MTFSSCPCEWQFMQCFLPSNSGQVVDFQMFHCLYLSFSDCVGSFVDKTKRRFPYLNSGGCCIHIVDKIQGRVLTDNKFLFSLLNSIFLSDIGVGDVKKTGILILSLLERELLLTATVSTEVRRYTLNFICLGLSLTSWKVIREYEFSPLDIQKFAVLLFL